MRRSAAPRSPADRHDLAAHCFCRIPVIVLAVFVVISVCLCPVGGGQARVVVSDAVDVISGWSGALEERAKREAAVPGRRHRGRRGTGAATAGLLVRAQWTRHYDDGSLSALIGFRPQSPTAADNHTTATTTTTTVKLYWRRNTCNVLPRFKYCDLPNSDNSRTYHAYYNQARLSHINNIAISRKALGRVCIQTSTKQPPSQRYRVCGSRGRHSEKSSRLRDGFFGATFLVVGQTGLLHGVQISSSAVPPSVLKVRSLRRCPIGLSRRP